LPCRLHAEDIPFFDPLLTCSDDDDGADDDDNDDQHRGKGRGEEEATDITQLRYDIVSLLCFADLRAALRTCIELFLHSPTHLLEQPRRSRPASAHRPLRDRLQPSGALAMVPDRSDVAESQAQPVVKPAAASQAPQIIAQGKRVLALSRGRTRVPLDQLGPALFNRHGAATSGRHCHDLGTAIVKEQGFATYRYVTGLCHEWDPSDPLAVSRHGNRMADGDPLLPRLPAKPLMGVFAKTHLVTFLQLLRDGRMPELTKWMAASQDQEGLEELRDVLSHGVFMVIFPWSVVSTHREDLIALMASDNFDAGYGLSDSCLRAVALLRESMQRLQVPLGMSQAEVAVAQLRRLSGERWSDADCSAFVEMANSTCDRQLKFLVTVWNFAECEAVLTVEPSWFKALSRLQAKLQWSRAALAVHHFLSDKETECSRVAGRFVAGAVSKTQLHKFDQPWAFRGAEGCERSCREFPAEDA